MQGQVLSVCQGCRRIQSFPTLFCEPPASLTMNGSHRLLHFCCLYSFFALLVGCPQHQGEFRRCSWSQPSSDSCSARLELPICSLTCSLSEDSPDPAAPSICRCSLWDLRDLRAQQDKLSSSFPGVILGPVWPETLPFPHRAGTGSGGEVGEAPEPPACGQLSVWWMALPKSSSLLPSPGPCLLPFVLLHLCPCRRTLWCLLPQICLSSSSPCAHQPGNG